MNERDVICYIQQLVANNDDNLIKGIGDDCAVVKNDNGTAWLFTMDTLVENIHFDLRWHPPELLGKKTVSVNISDIAAMGGRPVFILLSVGLPTTFNQSWFKKFSQGVAEACKSYGCILIGGDTVSSPGGFTFSVTAIGEMLIDDVVYRSGAQVNDDIWVTGNLGDAAAGLELLSGKTDKNIDFNKEISNAHLDPVARIQFGQNLARIKIANSMMDVSDGLATDLAHICEASGVKAKLFSDRIPASIALLKAAALVGKSATEFALFGGEDYELVFTAKPKVREAIVSLGIEKDTKLTRIGKISQGEGVVLVTPEGETNIKYKGFDHFVDN